MFNLMQTIEVPWYKYYWTSCHNWNFLKFWSPVLTIFFGKLSKKDFDIVPISHIDFPTMDSNYILLKVIETIQDVHEVWA